MHIHSYYEKIMFYYHRHQKHAEIYEAYIRKFPPHEKSHCVCVEIVQNFASEHTKGWREREREYSMCSQESGKGKINLIYAFKSLLSSIASLENSQTRSEL